VRIAIIADTHNRLPQHVLAAISGADEVWHLGDVCDEGVLASVTQIGPPVRVVRGNCDSCLAWPLALEFELEGYRIFLTHIPPRLAPPKIDLLFHGHTHVPRQERVGAALFFNPGCITRPNRGAPSSYAWLDLRRGEPVGWRLELV
jgi:putative phosphoesterase